MLPRGKSRQHKQEIPETQISVCESCHRTDCIAQPNLRQSQTGRRAKSLPTSSDDEVRGIWRGNVFGALVAELGRVDAGEQVFA